MLCLAVVVPFSAGLGPVSAQHVAAGTPVKSAGMVLYDGRVERPWRDASVAFRLRKPCDTRLYQTAPCSYGITLESQGALIFQYRAGTLSTKGYKSIDFYLQPGKQPLGDFGILLTTASGKAIGDHRLTKKDDLGRSKAGFEHISVPLTALNPHNKPVLSIQIRNELKRQLAMIHLAGVSLVANGRSGVPGTSPSAHAATSAAATRTAVARAAGRSVPAGTAVAPPGTPVSAASTPAGPPMAPADSDAGGRESPTSSAVGHGSTPALGESTETAVPAPSASTRTPAPPAGSGSGGPMSPTGTPATPSSTSSQVRSTDTAVALPATRTSTAVPPTRTATRTPTTPPAAGLVRWSSGYYTGWQQPGYPPSAIPWNAITDLIQFSAINSASRNGTLDFSTHGLTQASMQAAVAAAHAAHRLILFSIGGAEDDNWDAACSTTYRATFISNVMAVVQQYGYDGVDLDIEQDFGGPAYTDYTACVAGMRSALTQLNPGLLLTEAADPDWEATMLSHVYSYLNQINLMTYSADATQIAAELANYTSLGIPKAELGVGLGIDDGGVDGSNPADCAAKAEYVVNNGYGGVMQWDVAADAAVNGGQTPCFNGIAPYVPSAGSVLVPAGSPPDTPLAATSTNTAVPTTSTSVAATSTPSKTPVPATSTPGLTQPAGAPPDDGWLNPLIKAYRSDTRANDQSFLTGGLSEPGCYAPYSSCIPNSPSASSPDWVAFDISAVPASERQGLRLYFNDQDQDTQYNTDAYGGCYNSYTGVPGSFSIQTNTAPGGSAPPTSGWATTNTFTNNYLSEILTNLAGTAAVNWVRFSVAKTSACESSSPAYFSGQFDFYNSQAPAASGAAFLGDSIVLGSMGHESGSDGHGSYWSQALHGKIGGTNYPLLVDDGIGGAGSSRCTNGDLDTLLAASPGKYVVLALGMNDATSSDTRTFTSNMQTCIDKVTAAGKVPILPYISYTNEAAHAAYIPLLNGAISELAGKNPQAMLGPNFYTYFQQRQDLLVDPNNDLHPNQQGMDAMQLVWENWFLQNVYGVAASNCYPDPNT